MDENQTLLSSAKSFITESISNYRENKINFAILHAVSAAELLLKGKLSSIHPNLIYKNIDSRDLRREDTVPLRNLPHRLINLGVKIHFKEVRLVETIAEWRNQIVHHMPQFDQNNANIQLSRLLDFLAKFLKRELHTPLENFLPKPLFKTVNGLLKEWEIVVAVARKKAKQKGDALEDSCPNCGASSVLCLHDDKHVSCSLCESDNYYYGNCIVCKKKTVTKNEWMNELYCDNCIQESEDRYVEMMSDIK